MDKLHVLFLSMHYRPEPCDTRTSQLAKAFAASGHRATVLTSFPNYPFGKTYPGYRQTLWKKSDEEGVALNRVPMFPDHSKSNKRRALSYISFGASAVLIGCLITKRPNLIWVHHPPLTTGIAGWLLSRIKRVPFVLEIHDLWPEALTSTDMIREGGITRAIRRVCRFLYKRAEAIVVTSEGMREHLAIQGVPSEKVFVFPQWADEAIYQKIPRDEALGAEFGLADKFNVFFTGNIGVAQGLDTLLDAAKQLRNLQDLQIVCVGAGVELNRLKERVASEGVDNVKFLGQHAPQDMPKFFAWADAALLHLLRDPLFAITVPSKLQTYMAVGKPVLCGVAGDATHIVEKARCGFSFPPEEAIGLAGAIRNCFETPRRELDEMGRRASRCYANQFSQSALIPRYELLFRTVLDGRKVGVVAERSVFWTGASTASDLAGGEAGH